MDEEYSWPQKALHWLVALLVVVQVALGLWVGFDAPQDHALAGRLYAAHDGTGAVILALMLVRFGVRWLLDVPLLPRGTPAFVDWLSRQNHRALYLVLIVEPVIGWLTVSFKGFPWSFYGLYTVGTPFAKNEAVASWLSAFHLWVAVALFVLVTLHLLGVAYHVVIRRENPLRRIA